MYVSDANPVCKPYQLATCIESLLHLSTQSSLAIVVKAKNAAGINQSWMSQTIILIETTMAKHPHMIAALTYKHNIT